MEMKLNVGKASNDWISQASELQRNGTILEINNSQSGTHSQKETFVHFNCHSFQKSERGGINKVMVRKTCVAYSKEQGAKHLLERKKHAQNMSSP